MWEGRDIAHYCKPTTLGGGWRSCQRGINIKSKLKCDLPLPTPYLAVWEPSTAAYGPGPRREISPRLLFKAHEAAVSSLCLVEVFPGEGSSRVQYLATTGEASNVSGGWALGYGLVGFIVFLHESRPKAHMGWQSATALHRAGSSCRQHSPQLASLPPPHRRGQEGCFVADDRELDPAQECATAAQDHFPFRSPLPLGFRWLGRLPLPCSRIWWGLGKENSGPTA